MGSVLGAVAVVECGSSCSALCARLASLTVPPSPPPTCTLTATGRAAAAVPGYYQIGPTPLHPATRSLSLSTTLSRIPVNIIEPCVLVTQPNLLFLARVQPSSSVPSSINVITGLPGIDHQTLPLPSQPNSREGIPPE